jgi:hypothetical protein
VHQQILASVVTGHPQKGGGFNFVAIGHELKRRRYVSDRLSFYRVQSMRFHQKQYNWHDCLKIKPSRTASSGMAHQQYGAGF